MKLLSYIENTGTQYIDTGFKPNQNSGVDIDFDSTNSANMTYPCPFGSRGNGTSNTNIDQMLIGIQYPRICNNKKLVLHVWNIKHNSRL